MSDNSILKGLSSPDQLKTLSSESIKSLCDEIRSRIIDVTSENGGHVGPNLELSSLPLLCI